MSRVEATKRAAGVDHTAFTKDDAVLVDQIDRPRGIKRAHKSPTDRCPSPGSAWPRCRSAPVRQSHRRLKSCPNRRCRRRRIVPAASRSAVGLEIVMSPATTLGSVGKGPSACNAPGNKAGGGQHRGPKHLSRHKVTSSISDKRSHQSRIRTANAHLPIPRPHYATAMADRGENLRGSQIVCRHGAASPSAAQASPKPAIATGTVTFWPRRER